MVVTFIPILGMQKVQAAGDYPDVANVIISEDGVLTWDAYPGADTYWIGIDGGSLPTGDTNYDLKRIIDRYVENGSMPNSGSHSIKIEAYGDGSVIATWEGTYEYTSPYSPVTVGAIENVLISADGIVTWDPYPNAYVYWVGIDGQSIPTNSTEMDLHKKIDDLVMENHIENSGMHTITISADNERYIKIAEWKDSYYYVSPESPIIVGTVGNVSISSEGIMTWDSYSGAVKYWIGIDGVFNSTESTNYDLNSEIDRLVEVGGLENSGTHTIKIEAKDSGGHLLATWEGIHDYTSPLSPVVVGTIENVSISADGTMTWDAYPDTETYWVGVNGRFVPTSLTTHRLDRQINQSFLEGSVGDSETYAITVEAANSNGTPIGKWEGSFDYTVSMKMEDCTYDGVTGQYYNGSAFKPTFKVDYMGYTPEEGTDYTMTYTDAEGNVVTAPTNAGKYYAVFTGMGKPGSFYIGTKKVVFEIFPIEIHPGVTLSKTAYVYNGKEQKPVPKVDGSYAEGTDYTVSYYNNKNVGQGIMTLEMTGNYYGTQTLSFTIFPKKAVISKAAAGKQQVKLTLSSKASATGGSTYQIQYRIKGKTKWKTTTTKDKTKTIKKLKKGKKYQIRVRAYKSVGGTRYYGAWSKVKTTKKIR